MSQWEAHKKVVSAMAPTSLGSQELVWGTVLLVATEST